MHLSHALPLLLTGLVAAQSPQSVCGATAAVPQRASAGCAPPTGGASARLFVGRRWDNGIVPVSYAANVTPAMQAALQGAMGELTSRVRVQFVPRGSEADFVVVRDSTVNSSPIGRVGGAQFLDVANWNLRFEMVHALMHVLGFWHEHQRPDRDQFVAVQAANIDPQWSVWFQIVPLGSTYGLAYDLDSVTHFAATEGGVAGATTLVVLPPNQAQQGSIGQRTQLSSGDVEALRRTYGSVSPPTVTSVGPTVVPSFQAPALSIRGSLFDEVTSVQLDGVSMQFAVQSPQQLFAQLPTVSPIGTRTLRLVSGAGASVGVPIVVTGNDPPVLSGSGTILRSIALGYQIHADVGRIGVLLVAPDNLPSVAPGIVSLGIGNQFTSVFEIAQGLGNGSGELQFSLRAPAAIPAGALFWMQAYAFDPNNIVLPVSSSNVMQIRIL